MTLAEFSAISARPIRQVSAKEALETLKCERLARWNMTMTVEEYEEITAAHQFVINLLTEFVRDEEASALGQTK